MRRFFSYSEYIIAFLLITGLNFLLPRLIPGDPLQAIYGDDILVTMTDELRESLTQRFALDKPLIEQFVVYIGNIFKGDLGYSYYNNTQVFSLICEALPWTMLLAGLAFLLTSLLGFVLGIKAGYKRGSRKDVFILTSLLSLHGVPDFFSGIILLIVFGVMLGIFPLSGAMTPFANNGYITSFLDVLHHLVLPLLSLVLARLGSVFIIARNTMVSTMSEPFILTARAKGCNEKQIQYAHAGRNTLLPVITETGIHASHMLTAALFVEIVFSYPGMGSLLYNSIMTRDYPLIQGILLVITLLVLVLNFLIEHAYFRLDPRLRHAH